MSWPPEGSKPPVSPLPAPAPKQRSQRPSPQASPGETDGEIRVKPQAKATAPQPPQFGHDGIDPRRAAVILGLPMLAVAGTLLALFASTTVWWIAAGVAAAAVTGGVILRRSRRARGTLRRLPGAGRVASGLRRASNGRFARSPLGRAFNRAIRRPSSGGSSGGSSSRPKSLRGRLRSLLPAWAGGARKPSSSNSTGGSGRSSSGGRMRSMLSRLKPGGGRRPSSSGGSSGGRRGKPGGASQGGSKTKPGSLLGRASRSVSTATRRASRAVGAKLFGTRPSASSASGGGPRKPKRKGKKKHHGNDTAVDADAVLNGADKVGRLLGRGLLAIIEPLRGLRRPKKPKHPLDDFDPSQTYECGIDGEVIDGKHTDAKLGRIAKRAKKLAKQRAKQEKQPEPEPEWPNVEPHDGSWPATDPDDGAAPPERSLPAERDHDPPPESPYDNEELRARNEQARRERLRAEREHLAQAQKAMEEYGRHWKDGSGRWITHEEFIGTGEPPPVITSTNTTGGKPMAVSPTMHNDLITTAASRQEGWQLASDAFRRDADRFEQNAKDHDTAASAFRSTGNIAAAEEQEELARQLRDDEGACRVWASRYAEKARSEPTAAA